MKLEQKINKIELELAYIPRNLVETDAGDLALLCASWASLEVVSKDKFYYRAADVDVEGQRLYYIEQNGFRVHADRGSSALLCLMYIVGGCVVKETALGKSVYSPASGRRLLLVDSSGRFTHEHFASSYWMLPVPKVGWTRELSAIEDMLSDQFNFSEILALLSISGAWDFIVRSCGGGKIYDVDRRYSGVYSMVWKSLIRGDYSLQKIAYNVGLPVSTLSKFRVGDRPLMDFVNEYRRNIILKKLSCSDSADVALEEGFSSKYKMFHFLNNKRVDAGSE